MPHRARTLRLAAQVFGPPALHVVDSLADQAARWADHVLAMGKAGEGPGLAPRYIARKALDAVAFSLRHGLRQIAVPTKLVGVADHQHAVEALLLYDQLPVHDRPRLVVSHTLGAFALPSNGSLQPVGRVQPKHAAWLAPLLSHGAAVQLHAVTGLDRRQRGLPVTLGVNVRVSGLAYALDSLALAQRREPTGHLTLVSEPPVGYQADGGGDDAPLAVRLWRDADGTAQMSCPHCVQHSPTGIEWGYGGSGPADCALSVLHALADADLARQHYQAFKADVIARLPEHGGILRRDDVLAYLYDRETSTRRAA